LHSIRKEIIPGANEDPNQKKLDSFMPKETDNTKEPYLLKKMEKRQVK
jgi:hypothetical protein